MLRTFCALIAFSTALVCAAQGSASAQLISDQLEDIAIVDAEPIEVHAKGAKLTIQAPSSTYMLEIVNAAGKVVTQDPFNQIITVNTTTWDSGKYTVLAHTFNGLKQHEIKHQASK